MLEKLKPCPFCEGTAKLKSCDGSGSFYSDLGTKMLFGRKLTHFLIICDKCGIRTKAYLTIKGVVKSWNRRVENDL